MNPYWELSNRTSGAGIFEPFERFLIKESSILNRPTLKSWLKVSFHVFDLCANRRRLPQKLKSPLETLQPRRQKPNPSWFISVHSGWLSSKKINASLIASKAEMNSDKLWLTPLLIKSLWRLWVWWNSITFEIEEIASNVFCCRHFVRFSLWLCTDGRTVDFSGPGNYLIMHTRKLTVQKRFPRNNHLL